MGKEQKSDTAREGANTESQNADDIELAIEALAHVLQRHLLMFAYTTCAHRINPAVRKSPYAGPGEYIHPPDVPNYVGDDDDGEFLLESVNQRILLGHIQKAYDGFGKGKGERPIHIGPDRDEVEGGKLPAWHVYDWAPYYLEKSTKAISDIVCSLRKADTLNRFSEIADLAEEAARPAGHPMWEYRSTHLPEENIPWDYPQRVLEAVSRVKDVKSQLFKQYPKRAEVEKEKTTEAWRWKSCEKTKAALRRIPYWIYILTLFLAALLTCFYYLGWLEPIKLFIYRLFTHT